MRKLNAGQVLYILKDAQKPIIPCYYLNLKKIDNIQNVFQFPIYNKHINILQYGTEYNYTKATDDTDH